MFYTSKKLQVTFFALLVWIIVFPSEMVFEFYEKGLMHMINFKLKTYIPHEMGELFMCMNLVS
jgi:hypothetical protein